MLEKSWARRCAGDFEVPRQTRLPPLIRFIPKRKTDVNSAGVVQVVLKVTTDTTDDMGLALERYFGEGDGDSGHPHAPHSSRCPLCCA